MSWRRAAVALVAATGLLLGSAASAQVADWLLPEPRGDDTLTLLLLGSDMGPPRTGSPERGNADGFQLLFVSADRQHATFVSIPRDSWVNVAGRGNARINACLFTGPETCVRTVENVFGIEVDGYILTSMRAFIRAVDRFGGIEIDVPQNLVVGNVRVSRGEQVLDGREALVYGRDRKSRSDGDFGRSRAQAEMLAAAHRQVVAEATPDAALRALVYLRRHSTTDLSGRQLTRLAFEALQLPPENVQRHQAPARVGFAGSASVVFLRDGAVGMVRDAARDGRVG